MKLDPFIPVFYGGHSAKYAVTNFIEDFCSSGSKKAYVIDGQKSSTDQKVVVVSKEKASTKEVALKVVLYMTLIFPLLVWAAKGLFRLGHTYRIIPPTSLLQKEGAVRGKSSDEKLPLTKKNIIDRIEPLVENLLRGKCVGTQEWSKTYGSSTGNKITCDFSLASLPNLKFHLDTSSKSAQKLYQSMIYAQKVCCIHQLGLLVIPRVELVTVTHQNKKYSVLVMDKMDIDRGREVQEKNFYDLADTLNEAIKQLTLFSIKTGFKPDYDSISVLNNSLKEGKRKIVVHDFFSISQDLLFVDKWSPDEQYELYRYSLVGYGNTPGSGVLGIANEKQAKEAIQVAKKHLTWSKKFEQSAAAIQKRRKLEIEEYKKLMQFYSEKNILDGNEEISIEEDELGFSGELNSLTHRVIKELNQAFGRPFLKTVKEHRCFQRKFPEYNKKQLPFVLNKLSVVLERLKQIKAIYSYTIYPSGEVLVQA